MSSQILTKCKELLTQRVAHSSDSLLIHYEHSKIGDANQLLLESNKLYQEVIGNINALEHLLKQKNIINNQSYFRTSPDGLLLLTENILTICYRVYKTKISYFSGFNIKINLLDYDKNTRTLPGIVIEAIYQTDDEVVSLGTTVVYLINR